MLLIFGGIKGGSGKTTLATNICQMRSSSGKKVLLVDADDQMSAYDWSCVRDSNENLNSQFPTIRITGANLAKTITKILPDYDDIIVDTGGRDTTSQTSALLSADKFIMPFKPTSIDVWTRGFMEKMIESIANLNPKLKSYYVINQADSKGKDNDMAIEALDECENIQKIPVLIGNRKSFRNAAAAGMGVHELQPKDKKACDELKILYDFIYA